MLLFVVARHLGLVSNPSQSRRCFGRGGLDTIVKGQILVAYARFVSYEWHYRVFQVGGIQNFHYTK